MSSTSSRDNSRVGYPMGDYSNVTSHVKMLTTPRDPNPHVV